MFSVVPGCPLMRLRSVDSSTHHRCYITTDVCGPNVTFAPRWVHLQQPHTQGYHWGRHMSNVTVALSAWKSVHETTWPKTMFWWCLLRSFATYSESWGTVVVWFSIFVDDLCGDLTCGRDTSAGHKHKFTAASNIHIYADIHVYVIFTAQNMWRKKMVKIEIAHFDIHPSGTSRHTHQTTSEVWHLSATSSLPVPNLISSHAGPSTCQLKCWKIRGFHKTIFRGFME